MSTHKHIDLICVAVLIVTLALTVLFVNGEALGIEKIVDADAESNSDSVYFTAADLNAQTDTSGATVIQLTGSGAKVTGGGAYAYDGGVVITGGGTYALSGTLDDGSITVDANGNSKVRLILDGVTVSCADSACLIVEQADKVFLTLAEGSENSFVSGAEYSEDALAGGIDGVIFARDDLTVNGSGSLTVTAGYKHGLVANDDLVITGGVLTVTAPGDGLRANDSLRICRADITVTAGDDGIVTDNEGAYLYLESGRVNVAASDDAVNVAGAIGIAGGSLTISAGDDAVHADTDFIMTGGSLLAEKCYEGIEAVTVDISGGDITLYPADDGINANGGSDQFGMMGGLGNRPDWQEPASVPADTAADSEETWIRISGGTVTIVNDSGRDADGLDSNGDILISGGVIRISLTNDGSNSAVDYGSESGGTCVITGGEIIACGSYSMAESFDTASTQCAILYNFSSGAKAGTSVSLEDSEGNVLLSYEVPCSFSSVNLSSPALQLGETYCVVIGDSEEEITLSEVAASYGDAKSGGFAGTMNWGGMQQRGDDQNGGFSGEGGHRRGDFGSGDGQTPTPPEGEAPDMSQMPAPPEGEMPDMGQRPGRPEGVNTETGNPPFDLGGVRKDEPEAAEDTAEETGTTYAGSTWPVFALCAAVLVLALAFARIFRRRG